MLRILPLTLLALIAADGYTQVTLKQGTYEWKTWNISERADHGINSQGLDRTVVRRFNTLILENEYLRVTLLPEYGGRILSIFYKPTGHEELFQNPVGFADGIGAGNFYYNWLMVLGGIFPTFPEPEHGKTYLLPWKSEVVAEGPDMVSVAMSIRDDVDFSGHPARFNLGVTGLTCIATVTLEAGRSSVGMRIQLRNDRAQAVRYEYWTCHSLTPGSAPGDTKSPASTEMVVPIDRYSVGFGTGGIDRSLTGGQEFRNLAFYRNWKQPGIAYAEPAVTKPWWGVLNHDNAEGIFRIVDDPRQTPGLKFWTWGYKDSYPLAAPARQFIELWAGAGHQFFSPVQIPAATTRQWTETYVPTVGLKTVSMANENALVSLATDRAEYDGERERDFTVSADLFMTLPGLPVRARLTAGLDGNLPVMDSLVMPNPKDASRLRITRPLNSIGPGRQNVVLRLENTQGRVLLETAVPISVAKVTLSARAREAEGRGRLAAEVLPDGRMLFRFRDPGTGRVRAFDAKGRKAAP